VDLETHAIVRRCLTLVLQPVALFCVRHSLGIQDLLEAAKEAFVKVAKHETEYQPHLPYLRHAP